MSPRSSTQFEEMRRNSRKVILDAAFELFAKNGFHNTSIEAIRKKAGVSKGLIYNYFEKKEDLMKEVVIAQIAFGEEIIKEFLELKNPYEQLKKLIDISIDYLIEEEERIQLLIGLSIQIHDFPELENIIKARYSGYMPVFVDLFKKMEYQEPDVEAHFLAAYFDGLGMQKIVLGNALDLEKIRRDLYKRYHIWDYLEKNHHVSD